MDRDLTKTEKFWIKIITRTLFLLTYIQWVWIRAEIGSPEMFVESLKVLLPTFLFVLAWHGWDWSWTTETQN